MSQAGSYSLRALSGTFSLLINPMTICTGAAIGAFAVATVAGRYLTNPTSVAVEPSLPPVKSIISIPEASSQFIVATSGVKSPDSQPQLSSTEIQSILSAAPNQPPSTLQPFTAGPDTERNGPVSTQRLRSAPSPVQDALFWSFGAIVVGCVTGCMMISRQINRSKPLSHALATRPRKKVFVPLSDAGAQPLQALTGSSMTGFSTSGSAMPGSARPALGYATQEAMTALSGSGSTLDYGQYYQDHYPNDSATEYGRPEYGGSGHGRSVTHQQLQPRSLVRKPSRNRKPVAADFYPGYTQQPYDQPYDRAATHIQATHIQATHTSAVTVLPAEQSWQGSNQPLAQQLDIRKNRPPSSW